MPIDHTGSMNLKRKRVLQSTAGVAVPTDVEEVRAPHMLIRAGRLTCPVVSESIPKKQRTRACAGRARTASLTKLSESPSSAELVAAEALCALQAGPPSSVEGLIAADILMRMRAGPPVVIDGLRAGESIGRVIECEESSAGELLVRKVSRAGRVQRPSLKLMEVAAASNYAKYDASSKHR